MGFVLFDIAEQLFYIRSNMIPPSLLSITVWVYMLVFSSVTFVAAARP